MKSDTARRAKFNPDSLENPERLSQELRDGGFEAVEVHPHTQSLAFESVDALWLRMVRSSAPLVSLRKRLGEESWAQRSALSVAHLRGELGEGRLKLSTTAWLGYGVRAQF